MIFVGVLVALFGTGMVADYHRRRMDLDCYRRRMGLGCHMRRMGLDCYRRKMGLGCHRRKMGLGYHRKGMGCCKKASMVHCMLEHCNLVWRCKLVSRELHR